jgi:tetratricopeptide (TPR) repeat protein
VTRKQPAVARKRLFVAITIAFPVLVLLSVELLLRLLHYGPDLSLFLSEEIAGRKYLIMNPQVKNRYFSRVEFSPATSMDYFSVVKPPGLYRIFCLGGSTTVGYPYGYAGAFSTFLRDRLHAIFPDRRIEVINLGMTATNSFATVDILREVVNYQPDLVLVYDGHNEFYGALGVSSRESSGRVRWLTKATLRLIHFKTFLLLRDGYTALTSLFTSRTSATGGATMMEQLARGQYVPYRSPPYKDALGIFEDNLSEMAALAREHMVPIIAGTQVSNLRDCPPFVYGNSAGATGDSSRADIHYGMARRLDTLGRFPEAGQEYVRARDMDQLRFRTSSDFNDAIRKSADGVWTFAADMEDAFRQESPGALIGSNLILEHLHPNARGAFILARSYAKALREHALFASAGEWREHDTVNESELWARRSLTVLDELCAARRVSILTSGWPFTSREAEAPPIPPSDTLAVIADAVVRGGMTWEQGHLAAAEYFKNHTQLVAAEREYSVLVNQIPLNVTAYNVLAQFYIQIDSVNAARRVLENSLSVARTVYALKTIGSIEAGQGRLESAIGYLDQALSLSTRLSDRAEIGYFLGIAYGRAGQTQKAILQLQQVLQADPQYKPARDLLTRIRENKR